MTATRASRARSCSCSTASASARCRTPPTYGDEGSNTLGNTARGRRRPAHAEPRRDGARQHRRRSTGVPPTGAPTASWGRSAEVSAGKDTTTGHWEMMGVRARAPVPDVPGRLPARGHGRVRDARPGSGWLGNYPASGTEIIQELGDEHVRTGKPIVYTSADSVFQIAAHEDVIPVESSTASAPIARDDPRAASTRSGRVIARPFVGPDESGQYVRTHRRRDFALKPFEPTVLDLLTERRRRVLRHRQDRRDLRVAGHLRVAARRPTTWTASTTSCERVARRRARASCSPTSSTSTWCGAIATTCEGYARGLEAVDARMPELLDAMVDGDLLDRHGRPRLRPDDRLDRPQPRVHAADREGEGRRRAASTLGTRATFADIGETVLDFYGLGGAVRARRRASSTEVRGA